DASSLERTTEVLDRMAKIARETPGVADTVEFAGFNLLGGNQTNTGTMFVPLNEYRKREKPGLDAFSILTRLQQRYISEVPEGFVAVFPPPPVSGIGNAGGYKLMIQDRGNAGLDELQKQAFG